MKKTTLISAIISDAALIFCGAFAALTAAPTAYSISFNLTALAAATAVMSLLLALWFDIERYGLVFGFVFIFGGLILFAVSGENVIPGGRLVIFKLLSSIFKSENFELKAEYLQGITSLIDAATWFLAAVGAVLSLLIALFTLRWKKLLPSVLIPLPFLLIGLIYTTCRPALWSIIMLLIYLGGVIMTTGVRKSDRLRAGLFTGLIIPILLAALIAFTLILPEDRYVPIPYETRRELLGTRFGFLQDGLLRIYSHNPAEYDLSGETARRENDERKLFISASRKGSYLLRSHSYGVYSNGKWLASQEYEGDWSSLDALSRDQKSMRERLSVFESMIDERYVPYGFIKPDGVRLGESFVRSMGETAYSWEFHPYINYSERADREGEDEYYSFALEHYTLPDGPEKQMLLGIAETAGLYRRENDYDTALAAADLVRASGKYTLTPGGAPPGRDFVEYFLTEGRSGYCVHFASATTALLQAMGIPARYTIGCYAQVPKAGVWYEIPQKNAHAWTEVYIKGVGWTPIESTPGFSYDPRDSYFDPDSPEASTPEPTAAPTEVVEISPGPTSIPDELPNRPEEPELTVPPRPPRGSEAAPTASPKPSGGIIGGDGEGGAGISPKLIIPAAVILWFVTGELIRHFRERSFRQKDARKAVLKMIRYIGVLEKVFRLTHYREIDDLRNEAAFSDHDMEEGRAGLLEYIDAAREGVSRASGFNWFVFRRLLFLL